MPDPIAELSEDIHNFLDAIEQSENKELIETGTDFLMAMHNYHKKLQIEESKRFCEICYLLSEIEKSAHSKE